MSPLRLLAKMLVSLVLVALLQEATAATLRAAPGGWLWGPRAVWTDGSTTPMFHPFSEPMDAGQVTNVRASIEMDQNSTNCKVRPAVRYSDDGMSWDTPAAINTAYRSTAGTNYGTTYVDLTSLATPRNWVQFGVEAANTSAGAIQICNATILIQSKDRP